jgi:predicted O-methyltransferase YrrM
MRPSRWKPLVYRPLEWGRAAAFALDRGQRSAWDAAWRTCADPGAHFTFAENVFGPCQRRPEFLAFLAHAAARRPRTVVEIGMARCGTTYLLANALPGVERVIGIDFFPRNLARLRRYTPPGVRVEAVLGSSQEAATRDRVAALLAGRAIDLLFIDGDHAYAGVKRDHALYAPLVAPGGLVVLHDIVQHPPGGEVPCEVDRLWRELRAAAPQGAREFITAPGQTSMGIGVVEHVAP